MRNNMTFSVLWVSAGMAGIWVVLKEGLYDPLRWVVLLLAVFLDLTALVPMIPRAIQSFPECFVPAVQWITCVLWMGLGFTMVAYFFVERQMPYHVEDNFSGFIFAVFGLILVVLAPIFTLYITKWKDNPSDS